MAAADRLRAGACLALTLPQAPRVAINLFAAQLAESRLLTEVRHVLRSLELPPASLEIEITETIALQQREVSDQLQALRRATASP